MAAKLDTHAEQFGALGHPARLAILRYVVQGGTDGTPAAGDPVETGHPCLDLEPSPRAARAAGLLRSRREGTFIYYAPDFEALKALTNYLWEDCCKRGGGKACC